METQTEKEPVNLFNETSEERKKVIAQMRAYCDDMENFPYLPAPRLASYIFCSTQAEYDGNLKWYKDLLLPLHVNASSDYFSREAKLPSGVIFIIYLEKKLVCKTIKTGTKIIPAQPEREIDVFDYVCE